MHLSLISAYIGLGSNLPSWAGDPSATLCAAIDSLHSLGGVVRRSSLYGTKPVGYSQQPSFVNAVVNLETALAAEELLNEMLAIEQSFGRDRSRGERNGPRTLDLDLLLYGSAVINQPKLALPHPGLTRRRFVLAPLAEIAPRLPDPVSGRTMAELLSTLPDEGDNVVAGVHRLSPALSVQAVP